MKILIAIILSILLQSCLILYDPHIYDTTPNMVIAPTAYRINND